MKEETLMLGPVLERLNTNVFNPSLTALSMMVL